MHKEILVIDDNPDIRLLVSNILKERDESPRVYRRFFGLSHATADSPC